jgi:hypothetical protein
MWVFMAIGAQIERNTHVLRLAVGSVDVALGALHLGMQAGQGIARLRVIELGLTRLADVDRFPVQEIMALQAICAQATFMLILVACGASGRHPEIGSAQVFDFDGPAFLGRYVGRIVAFVAGQAGMLAFEEVSRFLVIEGFDIPLDQREVFPVVLRVAAGAFLAGARGNVIGGVQAFVSRKPGRYFSVTGQTLQRRLTAKRMATGAVSRSIQRLVRSREWSRGDLCGSHAAQTYRETHQSEPRGDAERKADRPGPARVLCHCVFWHYSLRFACKHV